MFSTGKIILNGFTEMSQLEVGYEKIKELLGKYAIQGREKVGNTIQGIEKVGNTIQGREKGEKKKVKRLCAGQERQEKDSDYFSGQYED